MSPWRSLTGLALARLGREEEARALIGEELALARRYGAPRALGNALLAAAEIASATERLDLLREAVAVLEDSPARVMRARALGELGGALRRAGQRVEAREPLRRGLELATRCGAHAVAARAREELVATGARPRRAALSGPEALTPSELRVVDLAAKGASNRDIAQSLFVSLRTVEAHLTRAYQKLGIASRSELAEGLSRRSE
jgi:DNA-binding NarL/FixJ family response regulator